MTVTPHDICSFCGHLKNDHVEPVPQTAYSRWQPPKYTAFGRLREEGKFVPHPDKCQCCERMARRVKELNDQA